MFYPLYGLVVVDKTVRGKGLGRILMTGTENYAKKWVRQGDSIVDWLARRLIDWLIDWSSFMRCFCSRGFSDFFLTTHDAMDFYKARVLKQILYCKIFEYFSQKTTRFFDFEPWSVVFLSFPL